MKFDDMKQWSKTSDLEAGTACAKGNVSYTSKFFSWMIVFTCSWTLTEILLLINNPEFLKYLSAAKSNCFLIDSM